MNSLNSVQIFAVMVIPVLFAITLHEVAHGWIALKFGDRTAQMMGRLTVNPIKHIDPIGTLLVPTILFFLGGFIFGWAKPVPVTWQNLRNPKRDMAIVALAGPFANLCMGLFWGLVSKIGLLIIGNWKTVGIYLMYMGMAGMIINGVLMILNLLPIPPLDGSRVASSLLPNKWSYQYNRLEPYGFFILIALIFTGVLFKIIFIPIIVFVHLIMLLFKIPSAFLLAFLRGGAS